MFGSRHGDFVVSSSRLSAIGLRWAGCPRVFSSPGVTCHPWVGGPEHADHQPVSEGQARGRNSMLASPTTYCHGCQIIFLMGVCFKALPLKCGLGNILDELLAQNPCFSV